MTVLYLAIDPGHEKCGVAWHSDRLWYRTCPLAELFIVLLGIREQSPGVRIVAIVERTTTKSPRYRSCVSAANACIAAIRKTWPRRNRIITVDPRTWQAAMLKGLPGDTKAQSIARAAIDGVATDDDNVADAVNMLNYLRSTEGL